MSVSIPILRRFGGNLATSFSPFFGQRFTFAVRAASTMTAEAFKKHGVVPDVIQTAPPKVAKVTFDSGVEANFGNVLTPTQVQNPPTVSWEAEDDALYTLIKTDPDAPSRKDPKLVVNIPGNQVEKGETLSEFIGAGPPENTGLHRYKKLSDPEHGILRFSANRRNNYNARDFAKKHNLGDPIAGNFYNAEYDDYVPKLYEKLGA
ncbi:Phosphatidylethanolamine-binding-like protein F40A3.3 [Aphelenchoides besseyi]|nr:Phosphatidylethanolamine-binding-like protein F40A3.3 [Aphelenchoides besseyi]